MAEYFPTSTPGASTSAATTPAAVSHDRDNRRASHLFPSTVNSSTSTLHNHLPAFVSGLPPITPALEAELARDEQRVAAYGGDDPESPPPRAAKLVPAPPVAEVVGPKVDPNLVQWDGPDDPENPLNWSRARRWKITAVVILLSINVTFASSAPSSTMAAVAREFGTSNEVGYLITSMFLVGYIFGPLVWGPGSELVGRQPIMLLTIGAYTFLHLGQALAPNMETMLVTRFLGGFFACAPLVNSGGLIADIWDPAARGLATSMFTAAVFLGPVMGPIGSSFIVTSSLGWRWVYWVMMIFAGVCWLISLFTLPETYAPILLMRKAKRLRAESPQDNAHLFAEHEAQDWTFRAVIKRSIFRPFIMLAQEPILLLVTIYLSVIYGLLYALFQALPVVFISVRGFTPGESALVFIGVGLGTTLGSVVNWHLSRGYPELAKKWRGFPPPEARLKGAMIAAPILVVGCLMLGWSGQYASVHWIVPALSTVVIGFAISLVFMSFLSYLVDTYLMYSASAFAANTAIRSAVAAGFPLFTVQMFHRLGVNWACTLLGLLALVLAPSPFLFSRYGPAIRSRSTFAPCADLKIAGEIKELERLEKLQKKESREEKASMA